MPGERAWRWLQPLFEEQREALLALGALLVFALMLTLAQYARLDERLREDLQVQADIVADTAAAAVVFDNDEDAAEILRAFKSSAAVEEALLLDSRGEVLAAYTRPLQPASRLAVLAGQQRVVAPIRAKQEQVGRLVVKASRVGIWHDLLRFVGTAMGMLVAAIGLAWLASHRLRAHVREADRRTRHLAHHDALTDLPNRETFRIALERAAQRSRQGPAAAVLFIDLDDFKQINDNHGHAGGDRVLQAVALRLRGQLRANDMAARLAGDEFALLLQMPIDAATARETAARIVSLLAQPIEGEGGESLRGHVSVGVALLPEHASRAEEAMQCADAAMYHAKRLGKDGYQLFTPELGEALRARLRLEHDLREALERGEISLAYQPLFDGQGKLVSFEALARWHQPQRGWASPAEFVPVAESTGLIVELGLATLTVLAKDLQAWRTEGLDCPPLALNMSSRQCRRPQDRERFIQVLSQLSLGPSTLEFELTESSIFEDLDKPDSMVAMLQAQGYALAIDDFGTGYSSLAYLRRMRCRKLKIDRVFVHGLAGSDDARTLVESIIRVAHSMHMLVVAEGVETEADRQCLVEMGCDLFQGFGLSVPLNPSQVVALLQAQRAGRRASIQAEQAWYEPACLTCP